MRMHRSLVQCHGRAGIFPKCTPFFSSQQWTFDVIKCFTHELSNVTGISKYHSILLRGCEFMILREKKNQAL